MALLAATAPLLPGEPGRPYRLPAVDLKQRIIWSAEVRGPDGSGLAFGGQDQESPDGRAHTRVLREGVWVAIDDALRSQNPLQPLHERTWALRNDLKDLLAKARRLYFSGLEAPEEERLLEEQIAPEVKQLIADLRRLLAALETKAGDSSDYEKGQAERAAERIRSVERALLESFTLRGAEDTQRWRGAQEELEQAAALLGAEPPPRSLDCGDVTGKGSSGMGTKGLVFEPQSGLYLLFGGDHLDYLTNDTWVFDPKKERWFQRHPDGAPPPRGNHRLQARGDGTIVLTVGYTYTSNTDYLGGQYADLGDGPWTYDLAANQWRGGQLVAADSRVYRSGPFHPDFFLEGPKPDAARFQEWLADLPPNKWATTDPPHRPRQNRDWGTAVLDPVRDVMLRWSGGHSAHGGTDVPHYHFATNRWELPFPVEFPLGQLYSNTSYPNGFNYNRRPWITGHTYQNYCFDPPSGLLVKAGRPRHYYLYDPVRADWIGRGAKPPGMIYNSCFYTLTLTATPHGALCWGQNGEVHLFEQEARRWRKLELNGETLPGSVVDNSTIAYDSKRGRVYMVVKPYGKPPFEGQVWSLDLKNLVVSSLSPGGMGAASRFAYIDRCVYDPVSDLVILASYLDGDGAHTPTPAYDPAANRWVTLDLQYETGRRGDRITRAFPHGRSCGIMFDAKRKLIWGTDTNSQVYVLRPENLRTLATPLE